MKTYFVGLYLRSGVTESRDVDWHASAICQVTLCIALRCIAQESSIV